MARLHPRLLAISGAVAAATVSLVLDACAAPAVGAADPATPTVDASVCTTPPNTVEVKGLSVKPAVADAKFLYNMVLHHHPDMPWLCTQVLEQLGVDNGSLNPAQRAVADQVVDMFRGIGRAQTAEIVQAEKLWALWVKKYHFTAADVHDMQHMDPDSMGMLKEADKARIANRELSQSELLDFVLDASTVRRHHQIMVDECHDVLNPKSPDAVTHPWTVFTAKQALKSQSAEIAQMAAYQEKLKAASGTPAATAVPATIMGTRATITSPPVAAWPAAGAGASDARVLTRA